jgi:hypothetical protein
MGTFHLTLANYIGQAGYPVGIDRAKGQVSWNNPIYAFTVDSIRDAGSDSEYQYKDVQTTVTYTYYGSDTHRQTDVASAELVGNRRQSMTFRYRLALDDQGHIVGGRAQSGSGHFLWIPLYPVQARADGTAPGNPYVDVKKVIAWLELRRCRSCRRDSTRKPSARWSIPPCFRIETVPMIVKTESRNLLEEYRRRI